MKLKNVIIYDSWFDIFDTLTDEQAGKLMKIIGDWKNDKDLVFTDDLVKGMFMVMKNDLDKMSTNYQNKVNANRENGKKGGRPKTIRNPINPSGLSKTQPNPKNLKEREKEIEKEKEIDKVEAHISDITSTDLFNDDEIYLIKPTKKQPKVEYNPKQFNEENDCITELLKSKNVI